MAKFTGRTVKEPSPPPPTTNTFVFTDQEVDELFDLLDETVLVSFSSLYDVYGELNEARSAR